MICKCGNKEMEEGFISGNFSWLPKWEKAGKM